MVDTLMLSRCATIKHTKLNRVPSEAIGKRSGLQRDS